MSIGVGCGSLQQRPLLILTTYHKLRKFPKVFTNSDCIESKIENGQGQCHQIVKTFDTLKESKSVKTRSDSSGQDSGSMSASGIDFEENRAGWVSGNVVPC